MTFADKLKTLRNYRQMTTTELAERAGVHRMTVGKIEQGARLDPAWSVVERLSSALGVSVEVWTDSGFAKWQEKTLRKSARTA